MSERGFIAVDRGLFDHPIFTDEPKTEREAWLWIIANACWAPQQKRIGSQVLELQRGQLGCSLRFLAKAWMWNDSRVRRFIAKLQAAQMIDAVSTQMATQITVCNYDIYQQSRRSSDAAGDAVATQTITKKQDNSEAKASSSTSKRGTRIGEFQPDENVGVELGLSPEQSRREAEKFRDWALSAAGQKGVKLDWPAAWRNWARRAFENQPKHSNQHGPRLTQSAPRPKSVAHRMADKMLGRATASNQDPDEWRTIDVYATRN